MIETKSIRYFTKRYTKQFITYFRKKILIMNLSALNYEV